MSSRHHQQMNEQEFNELTLAVLDQLADRNKCLKSRLAAMLHVDQGYLSPCRLWDLKGRVFEAIRDCGLIPIALTLELDRMSYEQFSALARLLGEALGKSVHNQMDRPSNRAELTVAFYRNRKWSLADSYMDVAWEDVEEAPLYLGLELGAIRLQRLTHRGEDLKGRSTIAHLERMRKDGLTLGGTELQRAAPVAERCISYHYRHTGEFTKAVEASAQALREHLLYKLDTALIIDAKRNWLRNIYTLVLAPKSTLDWNAVNQAIRTSAKVYASLPSEPENLDEAAQLFLTLIALPEFLAAIGMTKEAVRLWECIFRLSWVEELLKKNLPDVNSRATTTRVWWVWAESGLKGLAGVAGRLQRDPSLALFPERRNRLERAVEAAHARNLWLVRQLIHRDVGRSRTV